MLYVKKHIHDDKKWAQAFLFIVVLGLSGHMCCFNAVVSPCNAAPLSKRIITHVDHSSPHSKSLLYDYKTVHPWLWLLPMYKGELMHNMN